MDSSPKPLTKHQLAALDAMPPPSAIVALLDVALARLGPGEKLVAMPLAEWEAFVAWAAKFNGKTKRKRA